MFELSREELHAFYIGEQKSIKLIVDGLGCSYWKVRTSLQKWGIKIRTKSEGRSLTTKKIEWFVDGQGCWICTSHYRHKKGYHQIVRDSRMYTLHNYLYMKYHGLSENDMQGKVVMHTCDNPSCINIGHLQLGTQSDNMKDMESKGRDRWSKKEII